MPSPLGPDDFVFEIEKSVDDVCKVIFTTKANIVADTIESENAAEDLSDFLWDEEGFYEVADFTYESDLPADEIVEQLKELGFTKV